MLRIVSDGSLPVVALVAHFELDNRIVPFDHCEGELDKLVAVAAVVVVVVALGDVFDSDAILVEVPLDGPGALGELQVDSKREPDGPLIVVCTYFELGVRILVP